MKLQPKYHHGHKVTLWDKPLHDGKRPMIGPERAPVRRGVWLSKPFTLHPARMPTQDMPYSAPAWIEWHPGKTYNAGRNAAKRKRREQPWSR